MFSKNKKYLLISLFSHAKIFLFYKNKSQNKLYFLKTRLVFWIVSHFFLDLRKIFSYIYLGKNILSYYMRNNASKFSCFKIYFLKIRLQIFLFWENTSRNFFSAREYFLLFSLVKNFVFQGNFFFYKLFFSWNKKVIFCCVLTEIV